LVRETVKTQPERPHPLPLLPIPERGKISKIAAFRPSLSPILKREGPGMNDGKTALLTSAIPNLKFLALSEVAVFQTVHE
jgi:hypothetical protein